MNLSSTNARSIGARAVALLVVGIAVRAGAASLPNDLPFPDASGLVATHSTTGTIDLENEFFQNLGTNGRRCVTCHAPGTGWTITPADVQLRFALTRGTDPIFRTNDGSNSPNADVSTVDARRAAYSMLLRKGLIRVGMAVPADAEFALVGVDDPYGFASAQQLSLFRRPLPSTNLAFLSTVMWDGRETFPGQSIHFDLADQANGATVGHAEAAEPLTAEQRERIVQFETALFTAQVFDGKAGFLTGGGARGGPVHLSTEPFYLGMNDLFGDSRTGAPFDPVVFTLYDPWANRLGGGLIAARAAVARGQALFNGKPIRITGVSGINDEAAFGTPTVVDGTCTTCHDTPNAGDHSVAAPLDIGVVDAARRTPDMPLYTFQNKSTGVTIAVTDPGRALVTKRWKDIGRFKGPILRALAARAPYFHDGSARDLAAVVDFYDQRFGIGFTPQEKADLVAFLRVL